MNNVLRSLGLLIFMSLITYNGYSQQKIKDNLSFEAKKGKRFTTEYVKEKKRAKEKDEQMKRQAQDSLRDVTEFKISKEQLKNPIGLVINVLNKNDSMVYSHGVGMRFISGALTDSLNRFETNREDFVFLMDQVPPGNYLIKIKAFQKNGDVLLVDKKEKL